MSELLADGSKPTKTSVRSADRTRAEARREAFQTLMDAQLVSSYRLAAVILGNEHDAQDAVHDAAVKAWRGFSQLDDLEKAQAWLRRIVINSCRDRIRSRRRRRFVAALSRHDVEAIDDGSAQVAARDTLRFAFGRLSADERVVIVLRYEEDLTVPAIAEALGVPEGTVKSRLHYALLKLRAALQTEVDE